MYRIKLITIDGRFCYLDQKGLLVRKPDALEITEADAIALAWRVAVNPLYAGHIISLDPVQQ